jgi:hypothetical protein
MSDGHYEYYHAGGAPGTPRCRRIRLGRWVTEKNGKAAFEKEEGCPRRFYGKPGFPWERRHPAGHAPKRTPAGPLLR